VLFRINFFGWLLFAWVGMGHEWCYSFAHYSYATVQTSPYSAGSTPYQFGPREVDLGQVMGFGIFALAFGMLGRMLLLRWRRGYLIGLTLSALVCGAICLGAMWRKWDWENYNRTAPLPFTPGFLLCLLLTVVCMTLAASIAWGIWSALAHIFLPKATCEALLDWQRSQSNESASFFARSGPPGAPP
jgi:hypothetical protein